MSYSIIGFGKRYALPLWPWYLFGTIALALTNLISLEIPRLAKTIVDSLPQLSNPKLQSDMASVALLIIGFGILTMVLRSLSRILMFWPGRKLEATAKYDLFTRLMHATDKFFSEQAMGDIVSRLASDVNHIRVFFAFGMLQILNMFFLLAFAVWHMYTVSPPLTLACLVPLVLMVVITRITMPLLHKYSMLNQQAQGRLTAKTTEAFVNVHVIQATNAEQAFIDRSKTENQEVYDSHIKLIKVRTLLFPMMHLLSHISQAVVIGFGGYLAIKGDIKIGDIMAFNVYIGLMTFPLTAIGIIIAIVQRSRTALVRISEAANAPLENPGDETLSLGEPALSLQNVSFQYDENEPIIKDLSLTINKGEKIGIQGRVATGKTTLLNLIAGYEKPTQGSILVGSKDVDQTPTKALRRVVFYCMQSVHLFSDSIRQNLLYANPNATEAELIDATKKACLWNEIEGFPEGLDTAVGESGVRLSGGQKQRLALARMFLSEAEIILLDDVLSAVDQRTEQSLIDTLHELDKTCIVISHRPSVLERCHRTATLDDGRLIFST